MKNLMIDIETLGNKSGCVITSIAAVEFDIVTGETFREFYETVSIDSCLKVGLFVQEDTIKWWFSQDKEAQERMFTDTRNIREVLRELREFMNDIGTKNLQVWGNSNRFDLGILAQAFYACGEKEIPWKFTLERDVRTLVMFAPKIKSDESFIGVKHDPIADCKHQISYCTKIYNKISENLNKKTTLGTNLPKSFGPNSTTTTIHNPSLLLNPTPIVSSLVTSNFEGSSTTETLQNLISGTSEYKHLEIVNPIGDVVVSGNKNEEVNKKLEVAADNKLHAVIYETPNVELIFNKAHEIIGFSDLDSSSLRPLVIDIPNNTIFAWVQENPDKPSNTILYSAELGVRLPDGMVKALPTSILDESTITNETDLLILDYIKRNRSFNESENKPNIDTTIEPKFIDEDVKVVVESSIPMFSMPMSEWTDDAATIFLNEIYEYLNNIYRIEPKFIDLTKKFIAIEFASDDFINLITSNEPIIATFNNDVFFPELFLDIINIKNKDFKSVGELITHMNYEKLQFENYVKSTQESIEIAQTQLGQCKNLSSYLEARDLNIRLSRAKFSDLSK